MYAKYVQSKKKRGAMMAEKKPTYEELKHRLDTAMLKASSLTAETDQQAFITQTFVGIHDRLTAKQVNHEQYLKLINRLAAYKAGAYNDYIDTLAGAAAMNMLAMVVEMSKDEPIAADSVARSQAVTNLICMEPVKPDEQ
jgi:hypothetical protein